MPFLEESLVQLQEIGVDGEGFFLDSYEDSDTATDGDYSVVYQF